MRMTERMSLTGVVLVGGADRLAHQPLGRRLDQRHLLQRRIVAAVDPVRGAGLRIGVDQGDRALLGADRSDIERRGEQHIDVMAVEGVRVVIEHHDPLA